VDHGPLPAAFDEKVSDLLRSNAGVGCHYYRLPLVAYVGRSLSILIVSFWNKCHCLASSSGPGDSHNESSQRQSKL
jgi:hypothetical protein